MDHIRFRLESSAINAHGMPLVACDVRAEWVDTIDRSAQYLRVRLLRHDGAPLDWSEVASTLGLTERELRLRVWIAAHSALVSREYAPLLCPVVTIATRAQSVPPTRVYEGSYEQ